MTRSGNQRKRTTFLYRRQYAFYYFTERLFSLEKSLLFFPHHFFDFLFIRLDYFRNRGWTTNQINRGFILALIKTKNLTKLVDFIGNCSYKTRKQRRTEDQWIFVFSSFAEWRTDLHRFLSSLFSLNEK